MLKVNQAKFKETDIGGIPFNWKEKKLLEVAKLDKAIKRIWSD